MSGDEDVYKTRPTEGNILVIENPAWSMQLANAKNGSFMQIHHPHHGWLAFIFPPQMAHLMGTTFLKHAGACEQHAKIAPPSTPKVQ